MTADQARAILAEKLKRPNRWYPLTHTEKEAVRVVQATK